MPGMPVPGIQAPWRRSEALAARSVEDRTAGRVEADSDLLSGLQVDLRVGAEGHRLAADLGPGDGVGTHGLDDLDLALDLERHLAGVFADADMLGTDPQDDVGATARRAVE